MKSGYDFYRRDTAYRMLRKEMVARYGEGLTEQIWRKSGEQLDELCRTYPNPPDGEERHTNGSIFPRVAMYRVLLQELPDNAMAIMDFAVKNAGTRVGGMIGRLTSLPGMPRVFLRIFKYMAKEMFGPSAGFAQTVHVSGRNELRFDITKCPYCKYCELCGCPELTHTFCDSDVYCYGSLPGIRFERTQTLGTGGDRCDFYVKIEKKGKAK